MTNDEARLRILICAPHGKDAALAASVLQEIGVSCMICKDIKQTVREMHRGVGAVLAVEEVLPVASSKALEEYIRRQPRWSDLPVLVLTKPGANSPWTRGAYDRLGNLTLLERPLRAATLISAVRSSLRARQRQYEVQRADQRKDEFLAMLGHELRNPLAPIGSAAHIIKMSVNDPAKVKHCSEVISRQVTHMTGLLNDLLDVARVTKGLIKLEKESVDMRQIVFDAMEQANPVIHARRHHVSLHMPPQPTMVHGDRKRLLQSITNVINNAAKYTPEGGTIDVNLNLSNQDVVLHIKDNGIGMTPETVSLAFELFSQGERTSDRSQGGLGIGLSIVRSLLESHGGTVEAVSEGLGKGSTFIMRIPHLQRGQNPADAESLDEVLSPAATHLRVMLVDDNVDAAATLEMLLETTGYDVSVLHNATKAIEHASRNAPQVCLLDIGLPDMDGTELAQRLRQMEQTSDSILIAITGYGQEQDRERTSAAGFDHHFVKPIDTTRLLKILAALPAASAEATTWKSSRQSTADTPTALRRSG